jgi:hypothetical protein
MSPITAGGHGRARHHSSTIKERFAGIRQRLFASLCGTSSVLKGQFAANKAEKRLRRALLRKSSEPLGSAQRPGVQKSSRSDDRGKSALLAIEEPRLLKDSRRSQRSQRPPTESQTSLIEKLNAVDFERCA